MRRLALIATIVSAVALLWMLEASAPRIELPSPAEHVADSATSGALSAAPDSEPSASEPQRDVIAETPTAPAVIARSVGCRGRLAWSDNDAPIAGVAVKLRTGWRNVASPLPQARAPGEQDPDEVIAKIAARTDAAGRFELPAIEVPYDVFLWIDPEGPLEEMRKVGFSLWPGAVLELGTVWLDRRGGIEGRLVDAHGDGVAGARVRAFDTALDPVVIDDDRRERLLAGAKEIGKGRLWSDEKGFGALPAWVIERDERLPFPETTTGEDGAFVLPSVRPGRVRLVAQAQGKRDAARETRVRSGAVTSVGELAIPSGRRWHVTVLRDGAPAVGIEVAGCEQRGRDTPFLALRAPVRTDPTGGADLGELADGTPSCMLRRKPGWPWEVYDLSPEADIEEATDGSVELANIRPRATDTLSATVELRGLMRAEWIVTDVDQRLLDGATVDLFSTQTSFGVPPARLPDELQPKQKPDGTWVAMLPTSNVRVVARAPGYLAFTTIGWSWRHDRPLELTLTRCFALNVAVVDPQRMPVPGALVLARSAGIEEHIEPRDRIDWRVTLRDGFVLGVTDPDGLLRCDGMVEGRLSIAAMHPRFAFSPTDPLFAAPDMTITVVLQPGGTVQGFVTENGVAPTERRLVVARPGPDLIARWRDHELLKPHEVTTGRDGSYELTGLCEGEWRLATKLPGMPDAERTWPRPAPPHDEPVWIWSGGTLRADLELERDREKARFRGKISIDGAPRPGAVVRVSVRDDDRRRKPWEGNETTDSEGVFAFTTIPSGRGSIEVLARDGEGMQVLARREIDPKQETSLDFALQTNAIQAHVLTADGRALAAREVAVAQTDGGALFKVVTDAAGQIDIAALPTGVYRVRWTDDRARERVSQEFAVRPRQPCVYELIVE